VLSHWCLDVASHRPDVPVLFDGPFLGFGLWRSLVATLVVEGALVVIGIGIYARTTRARDRAGLAGLVAIGALLLLGLGFYRARPPCLGRGRRASRPARARPCRWRCSSFGSLPIPIGTGGWSTPTARGRVRPQARRVDLSASRHRPDPARPGSGGGFFRGGGK